MKAELFEQKSAMPKDTYDANDERILLLQDGNYSAYAQDVECMWRWTIYRNKELVQEGCSLSLRSAKEAVDHVMSFYAIAKKN
ncbi:soluble methane monooxygenase-binding protein MmoD [Methylotuvimicrobium buryatense]|nr:soluble methane monooxygenase-binding protein MmoD [Methylotuvimicrobium buryatense]